MPGWALCYTTLSLPRWLGSTGDISEVLGDFRGAANLFPNGRLVVFSGVTRFVQHILPVPCARAWLDFAASLQH